MAGIKLSVPKIIFPSNTKDLCIGVCIDAYGADLIINIEEGTSNNSINLFGFETNTCPAIKKQISHFLNFTELINKKISIDIRNIQSENIIDQPAYLSFCVIFALNQFFKQILGRDSFEEFCFDQGLMVQESMCAYHGGVLIFNSGSKGFIKIYSSDGVFLSFNEISNNGFSALYQSGDLISVLLALDRSDFIQMKSITSRYFPNELNNVLMVLYNEDVVYKFTQLKEDNSEFYKINRTGIEIA